MQQKCSIFNYVWNSNNYGAILTAYALSEILKNANIEVVNADCKIITYLLSQTKNLTFSTFKKNNLSLTENLNNFLKTNNTNKFSDIYITGSDQVFRIAGLGEHLYQYLLDFVNADKKKISFSASFGVNKEKFLQETSQDKIEHMKTSLKSFDFVSVREKSGVEICRDLFDVKAEWILDPVFILDRAKWDELIENATKDFSNKIVSYVLDTNKEYKKAHKYFSKKYNFEVIELANSNVSIENWLASIKNCEFLITDSFHGMCFAIIFNKPFICITNQKRGATRFESILEMLNIKNQCINNINKN